MREEVSGLRSKSDFITVTIWSAGNSIICLKSMSELCCVLDEQKRIHLSRIIISRIEIILN